MKGLLLLAGLLIALPVQAQKSLPSELDGYSVWYGYSSGTALTLCSLVVEGKLSPKDARENMNTYMGGLDQRSLNPAQAGFASAKEAQPVCKTLFD